MNNAIKYLGTLAAVAFPFATAHAQSAIVEAGVNGLKTGTVAATQATNAAIQASVQAATHAAVVAGKVSALPGYVPNMTPAQAIRINMATPTGMIPPYRIEAGKVYLTQPIQIPEVPAQIAAMQAQAAEMEAARTGSLMRTPSAANAKATKEIKSLTRGYKYDSHSFMGAAADMFRQEIPELVALNHGQMTLADLKEIRLANRRPLDVALLFRENGYTTLSLNDWGNVMNGMTNLGIFGTLEEDAAKIVEVAKDIPLGYVALTDYVAVRALLNLEAFDQLGELFKIRAQQFNWLDGEGKLVMPKRGNFQSMAEAQSFYSFEAFAEVQRYMYYMAIQENVATYQVVEKVFPVEISFDGLDWVLDVDMQQFLELFNKNNILKQALAHDELGDLKKFLKIRENIPVLRAE